MSLATGELASALPDEGGYVTWVRRAFGPSWGFQVGWWSWLNRFVDVAVYPALFVEYLAFWWPGWSSPRVSLSGSRARAAVPVAGRRGRLGCGSPPGSRPR